MHSFPHHEHCHTAGPHKQIWSASGPRLKVQNPYLAHEVEQEELRSEHVSVSIP